MTGALDGDRNASYRKARPEVRKMWNRAFFRTILVRVGAISDFTYEEPFASLLGSHKGSILDVTAVINSGCKYVGQSFTAGPERNADGCGNRDDEPRGSAAASGCDQGYAVGQLFGDPLGVPV